MTPIIAIVIYRTVYFYETGFGIVNNPVGKIDRDVNGECVLSKIIKTNPVLPKRCD